MRIKLNGKEYNARASAEKSKSKRRLKWYDKYGISLSTGFTQKVEAMLPEEIRDLLVDHHSQEELDQLIEKLIEQALNTKASQKLRIFLLQQLSDKALDLTKASKLTGIRRETLEWRVQHGQIRAHKEKTKHGGEYNVVTREEVRKMIVEGQPLVENWPTLTELGKKYNIPRGTRHDWAAKNDIASRKAPTRGQRQIHLHPSVEQVFAERAEVRGKDVIDVNGQRYIYLPVATREIMQETGAPDGEFRRYYRRHLKFVREGNGKRGIKRGSKVFISGQVFNWLKEHPLIKELSEICGVGLETICRICEENQIDVHGNTGSICERRINQQEFERAVKV